MRISMIFAMNLIFLACFLGVILGGFYTSKYYLKRGIKSNSRDIVEIDSGLTYSNVNKYCIDFKVDTTIYSTCSIFGNKDLDSTDHQYVQYYYYLDDPSHNFLDLKEDELNARGYLKLGLPMLIFGIIVSLLVKSLFHRILL